MNEEYMKKISIKQKNYVMFQELLEGLLKKKESFYLGYTFNFKQIRKLVEIEIFWNLKEPKEGLKKMSNLELAEFVQNWLDGKTEHQVAVNERTISIKAQLDETIRNLNSVCHEINERIEIWKYFLKELITMLKLLLIKTQKGFDFLKQLGIIRSY